MIFEQTSAEEINRIYKLQKKHRWVVAKKDAQYRKEKLEKLKQSILRHQQQIRDALYADFRKSAEETDLTEILVLIEEINFACKNLRSWIKAKKVKTPITLAGCKSFQYFELKGHVLILAPWNYPFQLMISPLIGAVAAGNVVMMRGSEKAASTQLIIKKIIEECFGQEEVAVILGEIPVAECLLNLQYDHIFFTGSTRVGKIVAGAAARTLTSTTLELGGKSPVIICDDADIEKAVERVTWAKFLNGGQTCVAPDYIFIHIDVKEEFEIKLLKRIQQIFGNELANQKKLPHLAQMIDQGATERLGKLIDKSKSTPARLLVGGHYEIESRFISPAVFTDVDWSSPLMQEELFGPVLPIITFNSIEQVCEKLHELEKPLALYVFSSSKKKSEKILKSTTSGGAVVNHLIIHLANPYLSLGGIGASGLGAYHGFESFRTFSHTKSVLVSPKFNPVDLAFPPYDRFVFRVIRKLLSYLIR